MLWVKATNHGSYVVLGDDLRPSNRVVVVFFLRSSD